MGDRMGSCRDVDPTDGMYLECPLRTFMTHPISGINLKVLVLNFLTHVKEGLPHYFLTMCDTWHTVDPSDLFVME